MDEVGVESRVGTLRAAFDAHHLALFRLALVLTHDRHEAEDIVQDVFERASSKLAPLREDEVGPYLRAAVVNHYRSRLRRLRVQASRYAHLAAPEVVVDAAEVQDLWEAVTALPTRQRATIVLRYYEDLSFEETASVMRCSTGTVKSQSSRALHALRRRLNG